MVLSLASESLGATKPISQPRTQGGQVSRTAFQFSPFIRWSGLKLLAFHPEAAYITIWFKCPDYRTLIKFPIYRITPS